jgi:tetratricopeptide (TPR) repeat protein
MATEVIESSSAPTAPRAAHRQRLAAPLIAAFLVLATVEAYWGVWKHDFVEFDDQYYVFFNQELERGLSWPGVRWAFTTFLASNWHPLTWLSLLLDYDLYGLNPAGYHATNLALHALNGVLVFLVFRSLTGRLWLSALVAAFFAVHPLHVESVAWVSERKDVLCACFFLLTLLAYASYVRRPGWWRYGLVLVLFALSLLAKPMAVTLPCLLLLLDYWPLGRTRWCAPAAVPARPRGLGWLVLEKLPLFALAAGDCYVTLQAQRRSMSPWTAITWGQRWSNAAAAYAGYLKKMLWPQDLSVFYLHPGAGLPVWKVVVACVVLAAVTAAVLWFGRKRPYLPVGWFWYVGLLVPVIGIVQVGQQSMADRYTYLPLVGIFVMVVWLAADLSKAWPRQAIAGSALAGVALFACMTVTVAQLRHWRNTDALWQRASTVEPWNYRVRVYWGSSLRRRGLEDRALEQMEHAIRLQPKLAEWHTDYGVDLWRRGRTAEAMEYLVSATELRPDLASAWNNLGRAYVKQGRWKEADGCYRKLVALQPDNPKYQRELAHTCRQLGRADEAREHYRASLRLDPDWPADAREAAWILLGVEDPKQRDAEEALGLARQANEAQEQPQPDFLETLAVVLAENGQFDEAARTAEQAEQLARAAGHADQADRIHQRGLHFRQRQTASQR